MTQSIQRIRPSARLLRTIGQDLIKDVYAAIVELVKNAYDADSSDVVVHFQYEETLQRLSISIIDKGHGMSFDTVINKWLVPATDDKLKRKKSSRGRVLQGRKGIGRYAAGVLGDRILMESTSKKETTSFLLDMNELDKIEYLDQLELNIKTEKTSKDDGTVIDIYKENISIEDVQNIWTSRQIHKLLVELRSLIAPEEVFKVAKAQGYKIEHDKFKIKLVFTDFPNTQYSNREIKIEPFPVLDLYDYKISGRIDAKGNAKLLFKNQNIPSLPPEEINIKIPIELKQNKYPGEFYIDLRVYDRDPDSIENIIKRGLKDPDTGEFVGKQEARAILDEFYGVGIYREQFRIRPYGEQTFDWLDLDKKRIQTSHKLSHNQVIGFVYIRPEELSGLEEKSARDGLKENANYYGLKSIVNTVIKQLEVRRLRYREKARKGGRSNSVDDDINLLFDFEKTKKNISKSLDTLGLPKPQLEKIESIVMIALEDEERKKSGFARKIRDTIAVYQGQATLGRITHVLLHEGRKHIKYISETAPRIIKWAGQLAIKPNPDLQNKLEERSKKILSHTKGLTYLFKKLEPLARTKRSPKKELNLKKEIESIFNIFSSELRTQNILYKINTNDKDDLSVLANEMDFITILSNLIENSIFWLTHVNEGKRNIVIDIFSDNSSIIIDYRDSGPGFQGDNLELMFEPGYSMKPNGTGLGLALAGDAIRRMNGKITAKHSNTGAVFELIIGENS